MYRDEHGIMHFEDDDGPPAKERPLRIGILNASGNPVAVAPEPSLVQTKKKMIGGPQDVRDAVNTPTPEPAKMDWPTYCAWRETKCRPILSKSCVPRAATTIFPKGIESTEWTFSDRVRALEEIDQATHELVGEVAELAELVMENGPEVFRHQARNKFIDECGDILFCGAWALDAWGDNPCRSLENKTTELILSDGTHPGQQIGDMLREGKDLNETGTLQFMQFAITQVCLMQIQVGLTANSYKKLRFQRREQDVTKQRDRIIQAFVHVNVLLITAGSTIAEAMGVNQRKLDHRYPEGYVRGQGGGIRTGQGA